MPKRLLIYLLLVVLTIGSINIYAQQNNKINDYSAQNNKIYVNNKEIQLNGISWSGSEELDTLAPHGLWKRNYKDMITQIKAIGFNAVRYPYCPSTLQNLPVNGINYTANPNLKGLKSLEVMDIILEEFKNQQIYILIDHHRPDCKKISELWYTDKYSEKNWLSDLTFLATHYKDNPYFIGLDIKNEPHGAATWGNKNPLTDFNAAAQRAAKAIYDTNPNILTFIEGIGNNDTCDAPLEKWWGGNFSPMTCVPLNYTGFDKNKIVYSPHVYGPDVYNQDYLTGNLKTKMPPIWESHFGFLTKTGTTVVPGEFGGFYKSGSKDREWQDAIIDYFIDKKICNTFYWVLNANSDDTGGILADDWITVNEDKVRNLKRLYKACNQFYNPPIYKQLSKTIDRSKLAARFVVSDSGDWGYCGDIFMSNFNLVDARVLRVSFDAKVKPTEIWSGTIQRTKLSRKWYMSPNQKWNTIIEPYSEQSMGFCSNTPITPDTLVNNLKIEIN
jgi:aryl-phospho-beta-D-glucosidase BglC (GH1 family)